MPRMRQRPKLDRRAEFRQRGTDADTGWFGGAETVAFSRWVAVRDLTGAELVAAGGEVAALQSRFVVRADADTEAIGERTHTITDERGEWDIVSSSRSPLRGAYLELLCVHRT